MGNQFAKAHLVLSDQEYKLRESEEKRTNMKNAHVDKKKKNSL